MPASEIKKHNDVKHNDIKEAVSRYAVYGILLLLLCLAVWNLARCFAGASVVTQDKYAFRGVLFTGLSVLILQKFNFKNFRTWIPVAIMTIPAAKFFLTSEMLTVYRVYERDIWGMWNAQWACRVVFTAILADAVFERKLKRFTPTAFIPVLLAAAAIVITGFSTSWHMDYLLIIVAVLIICAISFDEEKIGLFSDCLAKALMIVPAAQLALSLITVPYEGGGFYVGNYLNSITFAMVLGIGLVACFLRLILWERGSKSSLVWGILAIVSSVFLLFGVYITSARTALLGIGLSGLAALWIFLKKKGKSRIFLIVLGAAAVIGIVGVVASVAWFDKMARQGAALSDDSVVIRMIHKLWDMLYMTLPTVYDTFPKGSFSDRINTLTAGRLELWVIGIRRFRFLAGNTAPIIWFDDLPSNMHNTFLGYMYSFGVLPGLLIIAGWIWSFAAIARKVGVSLKKGENPRPVYLLAFLLIIYNFTVFLNELNYFNTITVFLQLLLMAICFANRGMPVYLKDAPRTERTADPVFAPGREKVIFALLMPLIVCIYYMIVHGSFDLYLPDSYNNDALFYYKLVEGMVKGGMKGFFGFNESSAMFGGFAAWNPAVVLPWVIPGFILRWGYPTVFVFNLIIFGAALALFVHLTDMPLKKLMVMTVLFLFFPGLPIHILNMLPEAVITSIVIIWLGFAIRSCRRGRHTRSAYLSGGQVASSESLIGGTLTRDVIGMLACCMYLTVVRPYMILLFIMPVSRLYIMMCKSDLRDKQGRIPKAVAGRNSRIAGRNSRLARTALFAVISVAAVAIPVIVYIVTNKLFTADYFDPLYDFKIIKHFLTGKITEGFWESVYAVKTMVRGIGRYALNAFSYGFTAGIQYVIAAICTLMVFICFVGQMIKKSKERKTLNESKTAREGKIDVERKGAAEGGAGVEGKAAEEGKAAADLHPVYLTYVITSIALFAAVIFLLGKVNEGGRHVFFLAVMGIILVSMLEWDVKGIASRALIAGLLCLFFFRGSFNPTDYDVPFEKAGTGQKIAFWKNEFEEAGVKPEGKLSFDNTVIWVLYDHDGEGNTIITDQSALYAVPGRMGISCCKPEYVLSGIGSLKSKYLATDARGEVALKLTKSGYEPIASYENLVFYIIR